MAARWRNKLPITFKVLAAVCFGYQLKIETLMTHLFTAASNNVEEETPLLMKRHQSLEEHRRLARPPINLSSRSLDRCLEEKKKAVNTKVAKVKEEADFQTELEEATQALLIASQCKLEV